MTTFTIQGYSRVIDYGTGVWGGFATSKMQLVRPDAQGSLTYFYPFIGDDTDPAKMVQVVDPHSHTALLTRTGTPGAIDLVNGFAHVERLVYALDWAPGKTTYIFALFQPIDGIEHIFAMGGDALPPIANISDMNTLMANATRYVTEGPFEGGEDVPLAGFLNVLRAQNDRVTALDGEALFWDGGLGQDVLTGGLTNDTLLGGAGHDVLVSGGGSDLLMGGTGNDTLTASGSFTQSLGGAGDDQITGTSEIGDQIEGGSGNDIITVGSGQVLGGSFVAHNHVNAGSGADTVTGAEAGDVLNGDAGDDLITGNGGDDMLTGGAGDDALYGGAGSDMITGGSGNDSVEGGAGDDQTVGGTGDDSLYGQDGNDNMAGGGGNDDLLGGTGADTLAGDAGNDRLYG